MKFLHHNKNPNQKNNLVSRRPFFKRMGRDVHVDWSLSVIFTVIAMIVLVVMGFLLSNSFNDNLNAEMKTLIVKDNSANDNMALDKILDKYDKKAEKRESLIQNYIGPKDPSI